MAVAMAVATLAKLLPDEERKKTGRRALFHARAQHVRHDA